MNTICREAEFALEIKRSRFVGRSLPCASAAEALAGVERVREANRDATHHCWAFRVGPAGEQARYDNSGEPRGTAGPPILDALKHRGLTNTLVVVTRYYGGVKLGAGGLVRAYGEAAKRVLEASGFRELRPVRELKAPVPYGLLSSLESYLVREDIEIAGKDFGELVVLFLRVPVDKAAGFQAFYAGLVGGKLSLLPLGEKPV
jgi:uncharacterized YigZ family protein